MGTRAGPKSMLLISLVEIDGLLDKASCRCVHDDACWHRPVERLISLSFHQDQNLIPSVLVSVASAGVCLLMTHGHLRMKALASTQKCVLSRT